MLSLDWQPPLSDIGSKWNLSNGYSTSDVGRCLGVWNKEKTIKKWLIIEVILFIVWSLTLREKHRLRVFENRVLRKILECKRDQEIGGWRKLHNEKLHNLYSLQSIISTIKLRGIR
jgi:hypothetical protein